MPASSARRADYDQTLKRLLSNAHDGVLALLLPGARWLGERSPELTAARRQADLVWEVGLGHEERLLLHIELQTRPDREIGERLAEYALRLWRRDRLPVRSVVIYLRESRRLPEGPFVLGRGGGEEALRFRYEAVRLWEEPPERVLTIPDTSLWPLAALMAGEPERALVTVAERIAQAPLPSGERGELTGLLVVLAGLRLTRPMIERLLRRNQMIRDLLRESSVAVILRDEGRAEGKAEGLRSMAQAVLESRFGTLDDVELAALGAAEEPVLRNLAAHLATDSRDAIRARLGVA